MDTAVNYCKLTTDTDVVEEEVEEHIDWDEEE